MVHQSNYLRQLGHSDIAVSALGLGCMGMTWAYGPSDEAESLRVLRRYVELGGNFLDTAEVYGPYANERLLGQFLREISRESLVVATKFGFKIDEANQTRIPDSTPANVKRACDASLGRLGIEVIDLFYQHRVDPKVPIEETVGAMAELVSSGKVRALGLSEAGPETLRRAAKVHPIAALQSEYSLWTRDVETNGVLANGCFSGAADKTGSQRDRDSFPPNDGGWRPVHSGNDGFGTALKRLGKEAPPHSLTENAP